MSIAQEEKVLYQALPQDSSIKHGKFANGMTYYVKENAFDTNRASLRLVVTIGSIHEKEEQRGLAHFVEHMVFRGTQTYPDKEAIRYLESIGAAFGADTNAYTTYDETVYMLDLPLDKTDGLEKALSILSEMAMYANLSQEQIDIEKKVVLDEMRIGESSVHRRNNKKIFHKALQNSLYADRDPIGLEQVITDCTENHIKDFYRAWYRPENMAIIAVGDFASEVVLHHLKKYFSTLPISRNIVEYTRPLVPKFQKIESNIFYDQETVSSYAVLMYPIKKNTTQTQEDIKATLLDDLILSMVNRRFAILCHQEPSPFKYAQVSFASVVYSSRYAMFSCMLWDEDPSKGLTQLASEYTHLKQSLFSRHELEIALANYKTGTKTALENANHHKNVEYAALYKEHFTQNGSLISYKDRAELILELLEGITLQMLNKRKDDLFITSGYHVYYFPSQKGNILTQESLQDLFEKFEHTDMIAQEGGMAKTLEIAVAHPKGAIQDEMVFEKTLVKKLVLSNGMQIYLEQSSLRQNSFSFHLVALGGLSSYDVDHYYSAAISSSYIHRCGLAGLSAHELEDALAGKKVSLHFSIDLNSRTLFGDSSNEDIKIAFQLIHAMFTKRTYREESWNQLLKIIDEYQNVKNNNPDIRLEELSRQLMYDHHYFFEDITSKNTDRFKAEQIIEEALSNPSEFSLVIVGDYEEDAIKECLETYLASLPGADKKTSLVKKTEKFNFPPGISTAEVDLLTIGEGSKVIISFPVNLQEETSLKTLYEIYLAENIINTRLLNKLRSELGHTYGVIGRCEFLFYPQITSGRFIIHLSTSNQLSEQIVYDLLEEVSAINATQPTEEELAKAIEIYKHNRAKQLLTNTGKIDRITKLLAMGLEPIEYHNLEDESASAERIHIIMNSLINLHQYSLCRNGKLSTSDNLQSV